MLKDVEAATIAAAANLKFSAVERDKTNMTQNHDKLSIEFGVKMIEYAKHSDKHTLIIYSNIFRVDSEKLEAKNGKHVSHLFYS